MSQNRKKFCFIICVTDDTYFEECKLYINQLNIPRGFTVEILPVYDAKGMAQGYNYGMTSTDAKYKVYMHQDVFILNPNFLEDVLNVFKQNWKIGMIGMLGNEILPPGGVPWYGERVGNMYSLDYNNVNYDGYAYHKEDGYTEVEAIDGFLMVTKEDVMWRDDIFDGWDLYDLSQSFEFRRKGYKIVVPEQKKPWCLHDTGVINVWGAYNRYRLKFLDEYKSMLKY